MARRSVFSLTRRNNERESKMPKITPDQARQIEFLRKQGIGYRQVALELGLSRDAVRYYCKANNLAGNAEEAYENAKGVICLQCGKRLTRLQPERKRLFCSDECRYKWWNANRKLLPRPLGSREETLCANCGKPILDYARKKRRYCSHECYIRDRFWRLEDGREPYVPPKDR